MPHSDKQEIARQLFLRLVTLGEGTEDTRRRALQSELYSLGGDEMQAVIRAFDESRLLTFDRDPLSREPTVELAHEAIIREWGQLRTWLDESRDDVRQQRLLGAAANEWLKNGGDSSYLLTGARLTQFEDWYGQTSLALTEDEHAYLHASLDEREHQAILESERQAREKALERRAQRVLRGLVAVFLVAAIVGLGLALFAFAQRNQAQNARDNEAVARATSDANSVRAEQEAENARNAQATSDANSVRAEQEAENARNAQATSDANSVRAEQEAENARNAQATSDANSVRAEQEAENARNAQATSEANLVRAEREAAVNRSLVIAASAREEFANGFTDLALILALEAVNMTDPPPQAIATLKEVAFGRGTEAVFDIPNGFKMVFTPDGRQVLSANAEFVEGKCDPDARSLDCLPFENGKAVLWDLETGVIIREISLNGYVGPVAISPDGNMAAIGFMDADTRKSTIILWDLTSNQIIEPSIEAEFDENMTALAFSPDGQYLLYSGWDDDYFSNPDIAVDIIIWDMTRQREAGRISGHHGYVPSVAFSPDGASLYTSGMSDSFVIQWDWQTLQEVRRFDLPDSTYYVLPNPDQQTLLVSSADWTVRLLNLETGAVLSSYRNTYVSVSGAITPDGKTAFIGSSDVIQVVDLEAARVTQTLRNEGGFWVSLSPDGKTLLSESGGGIRRWDIEGFADISRSFVLTDIAISVDFSTNGNYLGFGLVDGTVVVYDARTGQQLHSIHNPQLLQPYGIGISSDGRYAVTSNMEYFRTEADYELFNLSYWDLETESLRCRIDSELVEDAPDTNPPLHGFPARLAMSADGTLALAGTWTDALNVEIVLWDPTTCTILHLIHPDSDIQSITDTAISPNQRLGAAATNTHAMILLYDLVTGNEIRRFVGGHTVRVERVLFVGDEMLLSASHDGTMILWDVETGNILRRYSNHGEPINSMDVNPDRQYIASGGETKLTLWSFETAEIIQQLNRPARGVSFAPVGNNKLYFADPGSPEVMVWNISDPSLDEVLAWVQQNRYVRDITPEECLKYPLVSACDNLPEIEAE